MPNTGGIAAGQLKSIVERIERLEEEKKELSDDIRDVYAEAKANGFDTKTLRTVVKLRGQDKAEREEQAALLDLYLHALGMLAEEEGDDDTKVTIVGGGERVETTLGGMKRAAAAVEGAARG